MNQRQTIAIARPCATPRETLDDAFYRAHRFRELTCSTILTVNK